MKLILALCGAAGLLLPASAAGQTGTSAAASICDIVAQTGCGPGQKCAVVLDDNGRQRLACAPDGSVAFGGRCGSFAGVDDCVAGTACVGGVCRQACDPSQPASCPAPQTCTTLGQAGVGTCETLSSTTSSPDLPASTCDIVAQTGCGPGQKCTLVASDEGSPAPACVPDGTGAVGAACAFDGGGGIDDCVGGTYCVQGICQAICDPTGLNTCPFNGTCAALEGDIGVCTASTSTAAAPPSTPSRAACAQHQDCRPGTYCAVDGTCHPDRHRPLDVTASPSLRNFKSGRVCFGADGTKTVCEEGLDIKIDGRNTCRFNRKTVRCTWFGSEFDYEGFDPSIPIRCTWVRSRPANEGNWEGIRLEQATRGTTELRLPGACGHYVSAGFQSYVTPRRGAAEVVSLRFDCSYDGEPLFDVEYRFHFGP